MEPEQQAIPEPEVSMDDFISNAIDESTPEPEITPDPEPETQELEATEPEAEPEAETAEEAEPNEASEAEEAEPESQAITAPQSMSAENREKFYALPPEQQQWISDRAKEQESAFTKKTMEIAEQRKTYDKLEQVIAPRRQQLAMNGMDEGTAIGQLFALSDFAERDPVEFARYLFNQRGIPVTALSEPGQVQTDPQIAALQSELQGFKQTIHNQTLQQQQQETAAISTVIDEFSTENPYYTELESDMIPIISALRQTTPGLPHKDYLAKAYKMAMATNEDVSAKIAADNAAKTEAARIAKAKKDAAAAKKAAGTNIRSSGSLPASATKAKNVDDFIGALVDERQTA